MTDNVRMVVGGTAEDDAAAFLDAVERANRGESMYERVLSFQSWEGLASVMTEDVTVLKGAGLVARDGGSVWTTAFK